MLFLIFDFNRKEKILSVMDLADVSKQLTNIQDIHDNVPLSITETKLQETISPDNNLEYLSVIEDLPLDLLEQTSSEDNLSSGYESMQDEEIKRAALLIVLSPLDDFVLASAFGMFVYLFYIYIGEIFIANTLDKQISDIKDHFVSAFTSRRLALERHLQTSNTLFHLKENQYIFTLYVINYIRREFYRKTLKDIQISLATNTQTFHKESLQRDTLAVQEYIKALFD
jgi:hypothetical protein